MTEGLFQQAEGVRLSPLDTNASPPTFLAQLPSGRQLQISEIIYQLLDSLRTPKSLDQLAIDVRDRTGKTFSEAQLRRIIDDMLVPNQLLHAPDGVEPPISAPPPSMMALHLRRDLMSPRMLEPITNRLTFLFAPPIGLIGLLLIVIAHIVMYSRLGFQLHTQHVLSTIPLAYLIFLATVIFHEWGHLAACRRFDCPHGALGVGVYFLLPVFYAETSSVWRLNRWQRIIVDSAGMYFQELCTIPLAALYIILNDPLYLWVIAAIDLTLLLNLNPLAKFDGYWLLSDLLGVPNLHQRAGEILGSGIAWAARGLGLSPKLRESSPFLKQLNRVTYLAVGGYALLLLGTIILAIVVVGPALLDLVMALPAAIDLAAEQLVAAVQQKDIFGTLNTLFKLFWSMLIGINILILIYRPLRPMLRRIAAITRPVDA